jgi:hypothetical protein
VENIAVLQRRLARGVNLRNLRPKLVEETPRDLDADCHAIPFWDGIKSPRNLTCEMLGNTICGVRGPKPPSLDQSLIYATQSDRKGLVDEHLV